MLEENLAARTARINLTVETPVLDFAETITVTEDAAGDKVLPYSMPQAEYMCGCVATSVGMLLGYYDLYGYTVNGVKYNFSKLIPVTISINSRGSDGGSIYDMDDPSALATFIASPEYKERFYKQTAAHEKPYTFVNGDPAKGLNLSAWNCLADYLGTGQYWRGLGDLSTGHYDTSLEWLNTNTYNYNLATESLSIPAKWHDFKYGLSLYLDTVGYELDERHTYTVDAADYTFSDFKAQIDAGHPVLVSMNSTDGGHMVIAYGYNAGTNEIIFDDTYRTDCRMTWGGSYYYANNYYKFSHFSVVTFKTDEAQPAVEVYRGYVPISSGSLIYNKTLKSSGAATAIYVNRGGTASATTVSSGGALYVSGGGLAYNVNAHSSGFIYAYSGGVVNSAVLNSSSYAYASGGTFRNTVINSNAVFSIRNRGIAESVTVKSGGYMNVSNGGIVRNTTASGGLLYVSSNGVASNVKLTGAGGYLTTYSSGTLISCTTASGGYMIVSNGGMATYTTVSSQGGMIVRSGGTANFTFVRSGGSIYLSNAVANSMSISNGGYVRVSSGAVVNGAQLASNASMYVHSGGSISDVMQFSAGAYVYVYAGGTVNFDVSCRTPGNTALLNDLSLIKGSPSYTVTVSLIDQQPGAYRLATGASGFNKTITVKIPGGSIGTISVGGSLKYENFTYSLSNSAGTLTLNVAASSSTALTGAVKIYNSANAVVSAAKSMTAKGLLNMAYVTDVKMGVSSGGTVSATMVMAGASMYISRGGRANFTEVFVSGGLTVYSGGTASNTTIYSGTTPGRVTVSSGGMLLRTVASGLVYLNGMASATNLDRGGSMLVSGGSTYDTVVNSAGVLEVRSRGSANATQVNYYGSLTLSGAAASAYRTTVNSYGRMYVCSGAVASNTYVGFGGSMTVSSGGTANNTSVGSSGLLYLSAGGKLTGRTVLESGATVSAYGGILDFYLVGVSAGDAARVNNLGRVFGSPTYTVTVSTSQTRGQYLLAGGAAGFNKNFTVKTGTTTLGTLSAGKRINSGKYSYRLTQDDSFLWLTVGVAKAAKYDLDNDSRGDIIMTITKTDHAAYGATGAWLVQNDQTAAWGDLSTRSSGWEIFGTGATTAGKTTNDVYLKSTDNVVGAWTTNASGKVTGWKTVASFDAKTQVLGLGDFNGDGQTDLLLRNQNGAVGCHFTSGDQTGWHYFQSLGTEWTICAIGDLNGDGTDDVVLKHKNGFAGSWLTQTDGSMAWADLDTLQSGYSIVGCGDFNGDGTSDVLLKKGNYYGAWVVGNGSVKSWMGIGDLGNVTVEEIADFDADGKDDLRIRTAAGDLGSQLVKGADTLQWKYYGSVGNEWSTSLATI